MTMKYLLGFLLVSSVEAQWNGVPGTCAHLYEDPHLKTFDGKTSDCQGNGDFLLAKSEDSDFEIQARFTDGNRAGLGTVTKAIVITSGKPGEPKIEIDADVAAHSRLRMEKKEGDQVASEGECKLNYYVDGVLQEFASDDRMGNVAFQRRHHFQTTRIVRGRRLGYFVHYRQLIYLESGMFVRVTKRYHPYFGCYLNADICIPDDIKGEDIRGLLGNADGNPLNDYMTRDGEFLPIPQSTADMNEHCEQNWCVGSELNSDFFEPDINEQCRARHDDALEERVTNASDEIKEMCEFDIDCIEDTIITGDPEVGLRTLQEKKTMDENFPDDGPTAADDEETDLCMTPEGHEVSCNEYESNMNCEALGYDFGYKMDGCQSEFDGVFERLELTDQTETCDLGNMHVGAFDVACSIQDGSQYKAATIVATVDTVVKVKGGDGGTLYTDLKAGETYTLKTGEGVNYSAISHMEFCFKCPSQVVDEKIITCTADVQTCPDGTEISRDPTKDCTFVCPTKAPTAAPTKNPTANPTARPTANPTARPTANPTARPTANPTARPTANPTGKPTANPTAKPSANPTSKPTGAPTKAPVAPEPAPPKDDVMTRSSPPGTKGDPHFKTHAGEMYDFHGGCDLVLMDNPDFMDGLGMRVHIRTRINTWWSYVESAVVQIGDQTLEITGGEHQDEWLRINGVANVAMEEKVWTKVDFGGLMLRFRQDGCRKEAKIYLGNSSKERLSLSTYYDFVKVDFDAKGSADHYKGSNGLLGRFSDGKRVGRDGETFIEDVNAYGQEWQVTPDEPKLFHSYDEDWVVPAGQTCAMPVETETKTKLRKRRLANGIPMEDAEEACAHLGSDDEMKACIFDVIATQDTNMASVW